MEHCRTKREHCTVCGFSKNMCICAYSANVQPSHRIIVLQHPSEVKSSKGTVQLLPLVMPSAEIVIGETADDFAAIAQQLSEKNQRQPDSVFVLYPSESATFIELLNTTKADKHQNVVEENRVKPCEPLTLIFLDGTWRKTLKMWCSNRWLQQFRQLTFQQVPDGEYLIRKAKRADSLSTIEAIYHTLLHLDTVDVAPILKIFQQRVSMQLRFFPH